MAAMSGLIKRIFSGATYLVIVLCVVGCHNQQLGCYDVYNPIYGRTFRSTQQLCYEISLHALYSIVGRPDQEQLSAMVLKSQSHSGSDAPESQLKQIAFDLANKKPAIPNYGNPFPNPWVPVEPKLPAATEFVGPKEKDPDVNISDDHIYSNKISMEEIRQLPKFASYNPGPASKVLYVKNLGSTVKYDHLIHLFGRFRVPGDEPIVCKLMTGKMRGQAFVTCADVETASRCLYTLCGYKLRGRPMIISFRQPKMGDTEDSSITSSSDTTSTSGSTTSTTSISTSGSTTSSSTYTLQ